MSSIETVNNKVGLEKKMEDEGDGRLHHKLRHEDKESVREKHKSRNTVNF